MKRKTAKTWAVFLVTVFISVGLISCIGSNNKNSLSNRVTVLKEQGFAISITSALEETNETSESAIEDLEIVEAFLLRDQVWGFDALLVQLKSEPTFEVNNKVFRMFYRKDYTHSARIDKESSNEYIYIYAYCPNDGARSEFIKYLDFFRNESFGS